ncbi:MAG: hypothetical protein C7B45_03410 [Sulfobacillus acidophilus]|uniref:Flagellar protein FlgN n=1 Tax=Sulfobacillus acidophilus TaxID=53633 RepID=A0A2T2WMA6_9FIRM|nr:MAG: hypothetical protein C7B45_03410 [Sulfobacillus acidophilus]
MKSAGESDKLFSQVMRDLQEMQRLTEAKISATLARDPERLMHILQEQIDPMYRLSTRTIELAGLNEAQKFELRTHITRWANREQYLKDLLEKNIGYINYLRHLMGINDTQWPGLNLGL